MAYPFQSEFFFWCILKCAFAGIVRTVVWFFFAFIAQASTTCVCNKHHSFDTPGPGASPNAYARIDFFYRARAKQTLYIAWGFWNYSISSFKQKNDEHYCIYIDHDLR
jgi:hypothetical protein